MNNIYLTEFLNPGQYVTKAKKRSVRNLVNHTTPIFRHAIEKINGGGRITLT